MRIKMRLVTDIIAGVVDTIKIIEGEVPIIIPREIDRLITSDLRKHHIDNLVSIDELSIRSETSYFVRGAILIVGEEKGVRIDFCGFIDVIGD